MLKRLLRRRLDAFERAFNYDVSHMREILAASVPAFRRLSRLRAMDQHREGVPAAPWYAAKLVATMHEDCGSCTQLVADMALGEGVPPEMVRAVVSGRAEAMDRDVALAHNYARAVLSHDPAADQLRAEVVRRWGRPGLVSLAFGLATSRMYPTLKYALGYGRACTVVRVGDRSETARARPAA
jgi:hypothetical protein